MSRSARRRPSGAPSDSSLSASESSSGISRRAAIQQTAAVFTAAALALRVYDPATPGSNKSKEPPRLDPQMTLSEFFERIYLKQRLLGCSDGTAEQYRIVLRHLARQLKREPQCWELSDELLGDYMDWRLKSDKVAAPTVNKDYRQLISLWRHCRRKQLAEMEPTVEPLPEPKRIRRCWKTEQLTKILTSCREEREVFYGIRADRFWTALILVIYDTSVRISATMSIRRCDVDLEAGTVLIRAEEQKQNEDQLIELSAQTIVAIRAIWHPERKLLFQFPLDKTAKGWPSLTYRLKRILRRAGLPATRVDLFHKVRRTTASYTRKIEGLQAAKEHLGHSTSSVTEIYLDPEVCDERRSAKHLPRPMIPSQQLELF